MASILKGEEVHKILNSIGVSVSEDQIQPAGLDLTVDNLYQYPEVEFILNGEGSEQNYTPISLYRDESDRAFFTLKRGAYLLEFRETISIHEDSIGLMLPRSTLLRNGLDLRTALFDPGYKGKPKAMLVCYRRARIPIGSRIGQLIIFRCEQRLGRYRGRYQNEGRISDTTASS